MEVTAISPLQAVRFGALSYHHPSRPLSWKSCLIQDEPGEGNGFSLQDEPGRSEPACWELTISVETSERLSLEQIQTFLEGRAEVGFKGQNRERVQRQAADRDRRSRPTQPGDPESLRGWLCQAVRPRRPVAGRGGSSGRSTVSKFRRESSYLSWWCTTGFHGRRPSSALDTLARG